VVEEMELSCPKVYIVVLNWNNASDTIECLKVLRGIRYPSYEIVVVDNGSTDGSADEIISAFPSLTVIRLPRNLGYAGGNNVGIEYALANGAEFVCILNNDIIPSDDFLGCLIQEMLSDATLGVAGCILFEPGWEVLQNAGHIVNLFTGKVNTIIEIESDAREKTMKGYFVCGAAMLLRSTMLHTIGGFDRKMFLFWEDADLCTRALLHGYGVRIIPTARVVHKGSRTVKGISYKAKFFQFRNRIWYIRRYGSINEKLVFCMINVLLQLPRSILGGILKGRGRQVISLFDAFLQGWFGSASADTSLNGNMTFVRRYNSISVQEGPVKPSPHMRGL